MDIRCPRCGEPWDHDCLHDEAEARYEREHGISQREDHKRDREGANKRYAPIFAAVRKDFYARGCAALESYEARCSNEPDTNSALLASVAYELMGDDLDGAASMIEDAESLGLVA